MTTKSDAAMMELNAQSLKWLDEDGENDNDGETIFKRAIYPPGAEAMITVAEVERLRKVELELLRLRPVAVELAIAYKHKAGILWDEWQLIDRARAVGLLPHRGAAGGGAE